LRAEQVSARRDAPTRCRNAGRPWRGPPNAAAKLARQLDVMQGDIGVERGIAEQHIDELAGIVPDGLAGQRDPDLEQSVRLLHDGDHAADDLRTHEFVVDAGDRHFHALLDRDGAGTLIDRARVAAHVIDRFHYGMHATSP